MAWATMILLAACSIAAMTAPAQTIPPDNRSTQDSGGKEKKSLLPTVMHHVRQLDADDFSSREKATRALKSLGPGARPFIEEAMESATVEVRLRLRQILSEIPVEVESAEDPLAMTRITLNVRDVPASRILEALEKQSGSSFQHPTGIDPGELVSLEFKNTPFLSALDQLCITLRRSWFRDYNTGSIRFNAAPEITPHRLYSGPFRIAIRSITRNSTLQFGREPMRHCYVHGQIDVESSAQVTGIWMPPRLTAVTDEKGRSLVQTAANIQRTLNTGPRSSFPFTANLAVPDPGSSSISRFEGVLDVIVPHTWQNITLSRDKNGGITEAVVGEVTARLVTINAGSRKTTLVVNLERPPIRLSPPTRNPVFDQTFEIVTTSGERVWASQRPGRRMANGVETFTIVLDGRVEIRAVRIRSLSTVSTREIPFAFRDIRLP